MGQLVTLIWPPDLSSLHHPVKPWPKDVLQHQVQRNELSSVAEATNHLQKTANPPGELPQVLVSM